jgi:hypothetical protein
MKMFVIYIESKKVLVSRLECKFVYHIDENYSKQILIIFGLKLFKASNESTLKI